MSRRRNPNLKKSYQKVEMTHEQVIELKKCMSDPLYFIKNYVYVTHPKKGRIKFNLYGYQEKLIQSYHNERYNIVLSARQTGKTETSCAYLLWFAIFSFNKDILVVSKDSSAAMEIIKKIQNAYEELPEWLKPGIDDDNWNKHTCQFDNKSRIIARATTESAGRGLSIALLYCDELAFVKNGIQDEFWTAVQPTLSTGGSCIVTSTPNGDVDLFSTIWRGAESGTNGFNATRIYWDEPPGRDEKFKKETIEKLGLSKWLQEFECEFISSDHTLFDTRIVKTEEERVKNIKPAFVLNNEQAFWKPLSHEATYIVGVDPATGNGNDFSVIEVFEFPSMHQVMEYRTNTVSEIMLYSYLKKVLGFLEQYSENVYFSIEANGVGRAMMNLYLADETPPMFSHFMSERGKNKMGYTTTAPSKRSCALKLKDMFESRQIQFFSPAIFKELKTYIRKPTTFEALEGATDDCISAVYIIIRMLEEIAVFDPRAFDTLYKFGEQAQGDEWYTTSDTIPAAGLL